MKNIKNITKLYKELTCRELALAVLLSDYVSDDGVLRVNGKNFVAMTFCEQIGANYNTMSKTITSLRRKGIIERVKVKTDVWYFSDYMLWCVNPHVYDIKDCKQEIIDFFKNSKWK